MVARWESEEVARWISGLAGIQPEIGEIFLQNQINGSALSFLLREDFIRMGILKIDQQLILQQSIDLLLTLVDRLNSETLALLIMRIHSAATSCLNLLKGTDEKDRQKENNTVLKSPNFYASISHLSDTIVATCHWLGRLPFIENADYISLRRKIIKVLVQIRFLLKNFRIGDQINMPKAKLIVELNELQTITISLVRQNKDSLFSSDRYLIRVHLRRPIKDDVNIEFTTMPDFTHIISSIETEAMGFMGSGFNAINVGDEVIEINNQVVIGWDPEHFEKLIRNSTNPNEICLLVKKMPRHKDDEMYTKCLSEGPYNPRRSRIRVVLERKQQQQLDNRTRLLEQQREIDIESEDEALYQSKRSSQKRPDQHSSLPDLTEAIPPETPTSISSETRPNPLHHIERQGSMLSPSLTPRSPKRQGFESYLPTFLRPRQDPKSIIPVSDDIQGKDQPQLVHVKRIPSIHKHQHSPTSPTQNDRQSPSSPSLSKSSFQNKTSSPTGLPSSASSSTLASFSSFFKFNDAAEKHRMMNKSETSSLFSSQSSLVTTKPPLNDSRDSQSTLSRRRRMKRTPSYRRISCKDLGKGDCEGTLYRYTSKGALSFASWKLCWCVLKNGILYVFKSKEDINQDIEIKLEGKNISPAPEKRKYAFRIVDETNKDREYFCCSTRDEMAKWMNKMGLAAINFNINDSKIAGFHKGFVDSREGSPASMSRAVHASPTTSQLIRHIPITSIGDSENDSDKESIVSWQPSISQTSSIFEMDVCKEKATGSRHVRSSSAVSVASLPERNVENLPNPPSLPVNKVSIKKHHRTCSSPIRLPPEFEEENQLNIYLNAASRLSDSDSSNDCSPQRTFVNSEVLQTDETKTLLNNLPTLMLNSSGGFSTPKAPLSPVSSDQTTSSHRPSNNSVFLPDDDEFLTNYHRQSPHSLSSSSSQIYSPGSNRPSPLYISTETSAPLIPIFSQTKSSEIPPIFFPPSMQIEKAKTVEQDDDDDSSTMLMF